jgi:hypothetical protein
VTERDETRQRALEKLDALIEEMSRPLPRWQRLRSWHEGNGGWTEESRQDWLQSFGELRERVARGASVKDEAHHLVRWLDHSGIIGGRWFYAALSIQSDLWELTLARRHSKAGKRSENSGTD